MGGLGWEDRQLQNGVFKGSTSPYRAGGWGKELKMGGDRVNKRSKFIDT